MIELILLYKWTVIAAVVAGSALALVGSQLAARNQAVQTFVISQGAALGIVVGLALNAVYLGTHSDHDTLVPMISGIALSTALYLVCEYFFTARWVSRNTYYIGIFALLMSATYTVISLVPSLETHMAVSYFGDLALASRGECIFIATVSIAALGFQVLHWPRILSNSFNAVTFEAFSAGRREKRTENIFTIVALVMITLSVQLLGLLFTISCLFIPVMALARSKWPAHLMPFALIFSCASGVLLGVFASLWQGDLPTVPCVSIAILCLSILVGLASKVQSRQSR